MNLLLIDDHPIVTIGLAAKLRDLGHLVEVSHTLEDASRRIAAQHFELCVLDLDMNGISGTRLLLEPTLQDKLPDCVVVLSGTRDRDEIVGALEDGAHAFLSKTVPFDDVIEGILSAPEAYRGGEPGVWVQEVRAYVPLPVVYPRGSAAFETRARGVPADAPRFLGQGDRRQSRPQHPHDPCADPFDPAQARLGEATREKLTARQGVIPDKSSASETPIRHPGENGAKRLPQERVICPPSPATGPSPSRE